jgi:hypothetical protein
VTSRPTVQDLAQRDSTYDSLKSQAQSSIDSSASGDVSSGVQAEEREVEEAFKTCLIQALAAASGTAAANEDANIPTAFVKEAESCLESHLANLSPMTDAISQAAAYLQADVGGAVANQQPAPSPTTTTTSPVPPPSPGGSSFPWWGWALIAIGVIGMGSFLAKR